MAAILNATTPLFTVLVVSAFLADERATPIKLAGVAVGFAGVVVMIGSSALSGAEAKLWAMLGSVSYAFVAVYGLRFARFGVAPTMAAAGQVSAAAFLMALLVIFLDKPWLLQTPGLETWAAILGIAVFSTGIAYSFYFYILAKAGATNIALVTFIVPPVSILLGVVVLGERLEPEHFLGTALIGLGLGLIDGRLSPNRIAV